MIHGHMVCLKILKIIGGEEIIMKIKVLRKFFKKIILL